jgi:uncharacterized protein (DUF1697 family)
MIKYIVLLKGINVGGHNKLKMAELRSVLATAGFKNVNTYIQSGNIVLKSIDKNKSAIETKIKTLILNHFGLDITVLVRTSLELLNIFDACPFSEEKKLNSYFAILSKIPSENAVKEAYKKTYENEEYKIINDCLYFYCANGYGRAKFSLNFFEKKLVVQATARNYKTMLKLISMATESEANH